MRDLPLYSSVMIAVYLFLILAVLLVARTIRRPSQVVYALPPGPKGLPLVGNVLDMPTEREWITFSRWGETWGDICSVTVLGQPLIILNSAKIAFEMLDKKSAIYSDRPVLQMGGELVGWKNTLVLLPYGDRFRRYRRLFHGLIGSQVATARFYPGQELEVRRFLRQVIQTPDALAAHVRRATGAIILRISHGYQVRELGDPFVELADEATEQFSLSTAPGGFLVDVLPILRHVPAWLPGASFRRKAQEWSKTLLEMVDRPHNFVKQQIASGTAEISFSSTLLESKELSVGEEFDLKWCSASLYSGASDTTVSAIHSFFLAVTLYPEAAKKAQAEIDMVIGTDRLPTFTDRPYLPYVNALVMEVLRWHAVVPTAVPHRAMQDDIHDGYFIPKGSLVIPNIWKFTHDPRVYSSPFDFDPERFVATKDRAAEPDPRQLCFGFGRRTCPGLHLADSMVYISCVMSLAVFNFNKCAENGETIEPIHGYTTGTISHPTEFKCNITPRSPKALVLIQADEVQ